MKSSRTPKASKGQAMFLVILALPVIVGVLTLVMDVGNLYFNQVSMQVAIDSGVLSGALYLPSYPSQAVSVAEDYAERNGIKASEIVSCTVSSDNKTVLMTTSRTLPCFFCAVLGEGTAHADRPGSGDKFRFRNWHQDQRERANRPDKGCDRSGATRS